MRARNKVSLYNSYSGNAANILATFGLSLRCYRTIYFGCVFIYPRHPQHNSFCYVCRGHKHGMAFPKNHSTLLWLSICRVSGRGMSVVNPLKTKAISRLRNSHWLSIVSTEEKSGTGYAHIVRVVETTDGCFYNTGEDNVVAIHSIHRRCVTEHEGCQCCSNCHQYVVSQKRAQEIFNRISAREGTPIRRASQT